MLLPVAEDLVQEPFVLSKLTPIERGLDPSLPAFRDGLDLHAVGEPRCGEPAKALLAGHPATAR